jgi:hypothetical protein
MYVLYALLAVLLSVGVAQAELIVCYDTARTAGQQFYSRNGDPSTNTDPHCSVVTKASGRTDEQRTLLASTVDRGAPLGVQPVNPKYLKVVTGYAELLPTAEMDTVDQAVAAAKAPYAVAQQEVNQNDICANNTLQEIDTYWATKQSQLQATITALDNAIAALTAGPPKVAMQAARDAIAAMDQMFIQDSNKDWRYTCSRTFLRP